MPNKACSRCKVLKSITEFYVKDKKTGKLHSWCKTCLAAASVERYRRDPKAGAELRRKWAERNPKKAKESHERYLVTHATVIRERGRLYDLSRRDDRAAYRRENSERIKAWAAEYRRQKADAISEYGREYYRKNKDAVDARIRKAIAAKPGLYQQLHKAAKHRRRVRLASAGPAEKFGDREIFERDEWVCGLCSKPVNPELQHPDPMSASLDHRTPIAKGGGHTRENVQLAHLRCNLSKRDRAVASAA